MKVFPILVLFLKIQVASNTDRPIKETFSNRWGREVSTLFAGVAMVKVHFLNLFAPYAKQFTPHAKLLRWFFTVVISWPTVRKMNLGHKTVKEITPGGLIGHVISVTWPRTTITHDFWRTSILHCIRNRKSKLNEQFWRIVISHQIKLLNLVLPDMLNLN